SILFSMLFRICISFCSILIFLLQQSFLLLVLHYFPTRRSSDLYAASINNFFIRQNKSQKEAPFDFYSSVILGLIGFSSKKSVLKSQLMNTSCSIILALKGMVVSTHSTIYSSNARFIRRIASSLVLPYAINLATIES